VKKANYNFHISHTIARLMSKKELIHSLNIIIKGFLSQIMYLFFSL